ncbi:MAG: exonuclease domain-containing protein [Alphaproteobacteria bacterium]
MEGPFDPSRPCVLFDLELTAWQGSMQAGWSRPGEWREVIQIGAVRLGPGSALAERGAFTCLVRPVRNPELSDYIVALTGISRQAIAAEGLDFPEALARFDAFAGTDDAPLYCNGADHEILAENAGWHGIPPSRHQGRMVNFRRHLGTLLGVGAADFHSIQVAALAGAGPEPARTHQALADVRTVAAGLRHLIADGRL